MLNGFWVHPIPPIGYRYQQTRDRGQVLVRDEPYASIIQESLEGYASGRFQLQSEVKRFFESFPEFPRDSRGEVRNQKVNDTLTHIIYTGHLESEAWGVSLRPAQHEGLISFETWKMIQQRLNENAKAPARKDLNEDFPLRGFVTCGDCGHPLAACWSKGRNGLYPYYMCFQKGCESYRKSIKRDTLEGEFEALLHALKPTDGLFRTARTMFETIWTHWAEFQKQRSRSLKAELVGIEKKIEQLLDRIVDADSSTLISAYEKHITNLEQEKIAMSEQIAACGRPVRGFDETFRTAMAFLASPWKLWHSEALEDKRAVLKLTFADRLSYVRNQGFRTAETTLPFRVLSGLSEAKRLPKNSSQIRTGWECKVSL